MAQSHPLPQHALAGYPTGDTRARVGRSPVQSRWAAECGPAEQLSRHPRQGELRAQVPSIPGLQCATRRFGLPDICPVHGGNLVRGLSAITLQQPSFAQ